MSDDMSMLKKMKDKISDEVNSATNKLQNIQIIDQLASTIGQQVTKNDSMPHQNLPELPEQMTMGKNSSFGLMDDNLIAHYEDDEEIDSSTSPQHQLFNERSIKRLRAPNDIKASKHKKNGSGSNTKDVDKDHQDNQHSVIDINHLSSDLDDDLGELSVNDDGEIDLLTEKISQESSYKTHGSVSDRLTAYKNRYREVVHAIRKEINVRYHEKSQLELETKKLSNQISVLKSELYEVRQQLDLTNVSSANSTESEMKTNAGSSHQLNKHAAKIRDLEKIMAKCKESLKTKNTQLTMLKNSLNKVEKFKDSLDDLRCELRELKSAHETWTLSIAESKRVMHQEIEEKNAEIGGLKRQLKDGADRSLQQRSTIQNLESRLVSISIAHQKERDGLIKELTNAKNSAIRQLQKEHELQIERVKLDLEKSIEALKADILSRDQQIIRNEQKQQELDKLNRTLTTELEAHRKNCDEDRIKLEVIESEKQQYLDRIDELERTIKQTDAQGHKCTGLTEENSILEKRIRELEDQVKDLNDECSELKRKEIDMSELASDKHCSKCLEIQQKLDKQIENHERSISELTAQLTLITTANADQKKAISDLKAERDKNLENARSHKLDCDELLRRNESILQDMREYQATDVPSSTEFEYLKNIVYQFLMGREPVTLARVISAIFKFDMRQVDQICKIQEAIHQVSS